MDESAPYKIEKSNSDIQTLDLSYCPKRNAFAVFQELISATYLPWTAKLISDDDFVIRAESLNLKQGAFGKFLMTPTLAKRTKQDLARSQREVYYATFILAGEMKVEQFNRTHFVKRGDQVMFDSAAPATLTSRDSSLLLGLNLIIPKESVSTMPDVENRFHNVAITREKLFHPLSECLTSLSDNMLQAPTDKLSDIFDACLALLPVAAGPLDGNRYAAPSGRERDLLKELLAYVNNTISDPRLSPQLVAEHLGVSARYVHRLLGANGATFSSYVTAARLDNVRRDLELSIAHHQPISVVARRWGFTDPSNFFRSFRRKFGCSPGSLR